MKTSFTSFVNKRLMAIIIVCSFMTSGFAQVQVSGKVTDDFGNPLPGASVLIVGSATGAVTDGSGQYALNVPDGSTRLSFSFIGYELQFIDVNSRSVINVTMTPDAQALKEIVVTALGIERDRSELGYSIQSLGPDNLASAPSENIINSLGGKIAGVQTTSGGSTVGSSARIVIRGNASLTNNRPLYVVDGVPIDNRTSTPAVTGGLDWGDVVNDLNYEDIKSLTVLKGASAAALYGNRATNGVILIETKDGPSGSRNFQVNFNTSVVFDKASYFQNYQNEYGGGTRGSEFEYQRWLGKNPGSDLSYNEYAKQFSYNYVDGMGGGVNDGNPVSWGPRLDAGLLLDQWSTGPNSPWVSRPDNIRDYFNTGKTLRNNLSLSLRGDGYNGRVSITSEDIAGIIDNTDQSQKTFNGSFRLQPTDRITVNTNFTLLNRKSDNLTDVAYSSDMVDFNWRAREFDVKHMRNVFKEKGNEGWAFPNGDNPFYTLRNTNGFSRDRVYGNLSVDYDILEWLTFTARAGLDTYNENRTSITQSGMTAIKRRNGGGAFSTTAMRDQEVNADIILQARKQFSEDIHVDGLVGANYRNDKYRSQGISANDLTIPDLYTISNVEGTPVANMFQSEKETNSVYASVNGSYKDFLFAGLTARNDWSSTLPSDNRSYFYPSANVGLSVLNAIGFKSDVLSHFQLRGSLAKVGGDTEPYQLARTYSGRAAFGTVSIFESASTAPPQSLKPEETQAFEIGTDIRFLNDRFALDATFYKQTTSNHILSVPVSRTTGFGSMLLNAAEIENTGIELILNANIVQQNTPGGFEWDLAVNWARNKNMVNKLTGDLESIIIGPGQGGNTTRAIPGEEWGVIWGLGYVRNDKGEIVVNANGLPINSSQPQKLGTVNPDWRGGIQNTFRYKNFNMTVLVDMSKGGDFWSATAKQSWATGGSYITVKDNVREDGLIVKGVTADGSPNTVRVSAQDYFEGAWIWSNNEYPILDATYVKLREVTLAYRFRFQNVNWLNNATLSVFGRNLAILHRDENTKLYGVDPEVVIGGGDGGIGFENHQWPTTRTYGMKLSLTF